MAWPQADRLFRQDPRFLGADAAFSVELEPGRVLWLFGDTFVAQERETATDRRGATLVRNSVAIQQGQDPTASRLRHFYGQHPDGGVGDYFAAERGAWYWPGDGIVVDRALTVFLHRQRDDRSPGGLGFKSDGWCAARVLDPAVDPAHWQLHTLPSSELPEAGLVGASLLQGDGYVLAYSVAEPGDHAISLMRWSRDDFVAGDLSRPEYHGRFGWGSARPLPVITQGATEFSVTRLTRGDYVQVQSLGFGPAAIGVRFAPRPQGPFGPVRQIYRPPESTREGILLYAAKAHPEQRGAELVITYASNTLDSETLLSDLSLYFPRFVRLDL